MLVDLGAAALGPFGDAFSLGKITMGLGEAAGKGALKGAELFADSVTALLEFIRRKFPK